MVVEVLLNELAVLEVRHGVTPWSIGLGMEDGGGGGGCGTFSSSMGLDGGGGATPGARDTLEASTSRVLPVARSRTWGGVEGSVGEVV